MEDKYEESLKTVEDCEEVRHGDGFFTDVEVTKHPCEPQKDFQSKGTLNPSPVIHSNTQLCTKSVFILFLQRRMQD